MTENIIYTPSNIFNGIDFDLNTETLIINESVLNGVKFKELNFSARQINGKRPRGYGVLAESVSPLLSPLLIIIGDVSHSIDEDIMAFYARENFNVFMFDYFGEDENKTKFTSYPLEVDYANFIRAGRHFKFADTTARETCYFEWSALGHYAISTAIDICCITDKKIGLLGVGTGANIVWMLSSLDKRIAASCTVFSAGWNEYEGIYKYGGNNIIINIDEERERWLAGIATESYAKFITSPMLYVSSSNNKLTHMERASDTISRIPEKVYTLNCISPRFTNIIGFKNTKNILLFFKKFLFMQDISLPKKFSCNIDNQEGKAAINIVAEKSADISQIVIYYCEGEINPCARNWFEINIDPSSEKYTGYPKISFENNQLFAFANITYKNGVTISSNLYAKKIKDLNISIPSLRRSPVIYNSVMERDCFTIFSPEKLNLSGIFLEEYSVYLKEGPGGITGIKAKKGSLASFKVGDVRFKGIDDESFKFDVFSSNPQELTLYFYDKAGRSDEHYHICTISLMGGNIWQPIEIKKQNLKTAEGQSLKSWEDICMVGFVSGDEFLINNILWL